LKQRSFGDLGFESNRRLEHNLLLKQGSVADATLIDASSSTKNKAKKRDPEMSQTNKWLAKHRAKVERPFRVIKRQFDFTKVRYRGLAKNTDQLQTLFALSNVWMARYTLAV
jgi:IS5 family transposase